MKCPSCGSSTLVNDFETYECRECGHDSDIFHFELQAEIKTLKDALIKVEDVSDYLPWEFDHEISRIVKKALNK